jgi:glycosyltransferase involved in cell wall biosynthesis
VKIRALCIASYSDRPETETFIGLHRRGVDLEVICEPSAPHRGRLLEAGVPVTDLHIDGRLDPAAIRALRARLRSRPFDVLHAFTNRTISNGLIAARGIPVRVVLYRGIVGNLSFLNPIDYTTFLHPRVDRIVCVCEAVREFLLSMRLLGMRLPRERPVRIYKGHDLAWYRDRPADLAPLGVRPGELVIVSVANNRPRKGIGVLVDAMSHIPADAPVRLLLVGSGMDEPALARRIAESPHRERIHVTGYRKDAQSISAASHVFVLPTLEREGLPRGVIEAMCYGVPPVVTNVGGSPELVVNGESGIVVPPADAPAIAAAILQLLHDPALRARMGAAARERIRDHFRVETTIEQTHALYHELRAAGESSVRARDATR